MAALKDQVVFQWNRAKLKRLKQACDDAAQAGADQFKFDGYDFIVSYARYLIEYLEGVLPKDSE